MIRIPLLFLVLVNLNSGNYTGSNQDYSSTISTESIDLSELSDNETFKTIVESKDLKKDVELSSKIKEYVVIPIFQQKKVKFTLSGFVVDNFVGNESLKINVGGRKTELFFRKINEFITSHILIDKELYDIHRIKNNEQLKVEVDDDGKIQIDGKGPFALGSINTESANKKRKAVKMIFDASGMRNAKIKLSFTTSLGKDKKPVVLISGVAAACVVVLIIIGIAIIWCCVSPKCLFYKKFRNQKKVDVKNQPPKIDEKQGKVDQATQTAPVHHETRSNALVNQPQPRRVPSKERRSRNRRTSSNKESDAQPEPVVAVNRPEPVASVNQPEPVAPVNQPANVDPVNQPESVAPDNRPEPVAPVNQLVNADPVNRPESVASVNQSVNVDKEKSPKKTSSKEKKNRNRRSSSNGSDAQPEPTAQVNPSANVEKEKSSKPNKAKSTEKGDTRSKNNESDVQPDLGPPVHRPVNAETEKPSQPNEIQRAATEENGVSRSQSVEVDKEKKQNDEPANQKKEDNSGYSKNENATESVTSVDQNVKVEKEEFKKAASDGRGNNAENATTSADVVKKRNETVADENNAAQSTVEQPAKTEDAANESKKAEDEAAVHPGPSNLPDASQPGPSGVAVIKGQSLSDFVFDLFSRYGEKNPAEAVFAYIYEGKTTYKMPQKMSDPPTEEQKREALEYYYQDFAIRFKEQHKSGKKKKRRKSKSSDDTIAE